MIEISEQFEVLAPPQTVWELLSDPDAVVGCVPGAAIVELLIGAKAERQPLESVARPISSVDA